MVVFYSLFEEVGTMKKLMNLMIVLAIVAVLFAGYMFYKSYIIFQSMDSIRNVAEFNNHLTRIVLFASEYSLARDEGVKALYNEEVEKLNAFVKTMKVPKKMESTEQDIIRRVKNLEQLFDQNPDIATINKQVIDILDRLHEIQINAIDITRSSIMTLLIISIILGIIMMSSLLYAIYLTRSVLGAVYELERLASYMADGKLQVEGVEVDSRTEVGVALLKLMKVIDERLVPLVRSVVESTRDMDHLIDTLNSASDVMANTVVEFRAQSDTISSESVKIRDAIDNALASVAEVLGGTENVANSAVNLSQIADQLNRIVEEGRESMEALDSAMQRVVTSTDSATASIKELERWTERINEIVKTVGDIAEQTNLLALNAAIEAARAGEAGRGFAVVAEEIRKLAEGSRQAADEIADVLKTVTSNIKRATAEMEEVESAVQVSGQAGATMNDVLSKITESAMNVSEGAESLAALAEEQTAAAQNISSELGGIRDLVHSFTSGVQTIASGVKDISEIAQRIESISEKLGDLADDLSRKVQFFKV